MDQTTTQPTHTGLMDFRAWINELERTGHLVKIADGSTRKPKPAPSCAWPTSASPRRSGSPI